MILQELFPVGSNSESVFDASTKVKVELTGVMIIDNIDERYFFDNSELLCENEASKLASRDILNMDVELLLALWRDY